MLLKILNYTHTFIILASFLWIFFLFREQLAVHQQWVFANWSLQNTHIKLLVGFWNFFKKKHGEMNSWYAYFYKPNLVA
jgi:hypothetical protein